MVVAVAVVGMVEVAVDEVVDVIPMRHRRVAAAGAMHMTWRMPGTPVRRGAVSGVVLVHIDDMLVDVILVGVVEVAVVEVVDVIVVLDRQMSAVRSVDMRMVSVNGAGHEASFLM